MSPSLKTHLADDVRQISAGHFEGGLAAGQEVQLLSRQAHMHLPLKHPHSGRDGTLESHYGLHLLSRSGTLTDTLFSS